MNPQGANVLIVDDNPGFRSSLERFLRSVGFSVQAFPTAADFLEAGSPAAPACALVDLRMPGMNGLELQEELTRRGRTLPLVFLTAFGAVAASVQAMMRGAVDFLEKPFEEERLLDAIDRALEKDVRAQRQNSDRQHALERLARITTREREVCDCLMAGLLNKQIAAQLGVAESTVKVHRSRMMQKLGVSSLVDLTRLVDRARGG